MGMRGWIDGSLSIYKRPFSRNKLQRCSKLFFSAKLLFLASVICVTLGFWQIFDGMEEQTEFLFHT